jgi:putative CRISPR-associated protein (TIGR02619 family)
VGTSLKNNLQHQDQELFGLFSHGQFRALASKMLTYEPTTRLLGAEINSTDSIMKKKDSRQKPLLGGREHLYLLTSDTEDGESVGTVLRQYYAHPENPWKWARVESRRIAGLQDGDPQRFEKEGLRHLVQEIGAIAGRHGSNALLINATGGYKAQISFAGLIGQALQIPVCYQFEDFSEVIVLPPQPVALDMHFWLEHVQLFYELAENEGDALETTQEPRFDPLVDEITVDGQHVRGLSAIGQLFHETFRHLFRLQREKFLPPEAGLKPEAKKVRYEKSVPGRPPGIENWFERLKRVPFVKEIYTHYYNPDLPLAHYFRPSSRTDVSQVEGGFSDGKATIKFDIITTATTKAQRAAALEYLKEHFLTQ